MIEIFFKTAQDPNFQEIKKYSPDSWIHVDEAKTEEIKKICEITDLEIEDLQDSLDKHETPRVEQKDDKIIIFARHAEDEEEGQHTATFTIIVTKKYMITISPIKSSLISSIKSSKTQLATRQRSKLLLFFLLKITQNFTSNIKKANYEVINQEKRTKNIDNKSIVMLTKNEEKLNQYLSCLVPLKSVIQSISTGRIISILEKDYELLQDLQIALSQSEDLCRVNVKSIKSLRDAYQIIFTNELNKTIKLLTAITIIFTIPTIIASIYGMNVDLPFAKLPTAFSIIMIITGVACVASILVFIKKRWL